MKKWCDEYFATESSDIYCSKRKLVKRSSSSKNGAKQSTMLYAFPKVFNQLETYLQKELPRYTFITSWINSNGYDSFNKPHWHSRIKNDDRISGIYYVSVPDKNMGNLYFETGEEYEPIENRLILFVNLYFQDCILDLQMNVQNNSKDQLFLNFFYFL